MTNSLNQETFKLGHLMKSIWFFLDEDKLKFVMWNTIIFIGYSFKLVPPLILGLITDFFISYNKGDSLFPFYMYCFILGVLYVLVSIVRLTAKKVLGDIAVRAKYRVKVRGFDRLLDFSLKWHDKENSGNKVQRMVNGGDGIKNWIKLLYGDIFPILVVYIGTIIIFLFLDWKFLIFVCIYLVAFFSIEFFYNRKIARLTDELNKATEKSSGTYYESTNNILSIKSLGAKNSLSDNVKKFEKEVLQINYKIRIYGTTKWKFFQSLNGISLAVFLYLIGSGVLRGTISIGFILVFYNYFDKLRSSSQDVTKIIEDIITNTSAVKRMMPIFLENERNFFGDKNFPSNWNMISVKNANFSYSNLKGDFSLSDISINIRKGEKVGLVGHTGCGKSTFVKLFMGLYPISKGEFKIGDMRYYDIKHEEITKNISIVLQETELFNMTLKENITVLKRIDKKIFELAIKVSQLESVIKKLPEGLDTLIGEKGYRLSGGERQRVGIARAICQNTQIIILDEATSALDSKTEKLILEGIEKYFENKTIIMIAHRLSTLENVHKIVVFDRGKIIETGKFNDLLKNKKSIFKQLWETQNKKR